MRLALYQIDIPQNLGTMLRMAACFDVKVDIIEPCGFPLDDRKLRRAGMDYMSHVELTRHHSWEKFQQWKSAIATKPRLVLLTTKTSVSYSDFTFQPDDILMVGRESSGVPEAVHDEVDASVVIPMANGMRSLNVAVAAGIVLSEALRQTELLPK